jgi:hypothetical protein
VITTIVEGSVITYHCEEGLMIEGEVEALCGADGEWRPHPSNLNCSGNTVSRDTTSSVVNGTVTSTLGKVFM